MFTGIIREVGRLARVVSQGDSRRLEVACQRTLEGLRFGDSVAVDGVCLTVAALKPASFEAVVMEETFGRTTLATHRPGAAVNLEPSLRLGQPLDGHLVLGHVDGMGRLERFEERGASKLVWWSAPTELLPFFAVKGSVALDGISLTLVEVDDQAGQCSVSVLNQTLVETSLGDKGIGAAVNLEVDVLARYALRGLAFAQGKPPSGVTRELLEHSGFL